VQARPQRQRGEDGGLLGGDDGHAGGDGACRVFVAGAFERALGELEEEHVVGGLFAPEFVVEGDEVGGGLAAAQLVGQEVKPFARSGPDDDRDDEAVDIGAPGSVRMTQQLLDVAGGAARAMLD
jgi:hypothetical protein